MARILVVDDSKFMRLKLGRILTGAGHEIAGEATDADEAVRLFNQLTPDLVTLDIVLPDDGELDSLGGLRAMVAARPDARVVVVSGLDEDGVVAEFLAAGARELIAKPFDPAGVTAVLNRVLAD